MRRGSGYLPWQRWLIRTVVRRYDVDLSDATEPDLRAWPTFNAFFTRALRPDARPLPAEPDAVAAPSDGIVQDAGDIADSRLVQAKSLTYTVEALLGDRPRSRRRLHRRLHRHHLPRSRVTTTGSTSRSTEPRTSPSFTSPATASA